MKKITLLFALVLLVSCGKNSSSHAPQPETLTPTAPEIQTPQIDPVVVDKYLKMVNDYRAGLGLATLEMAPIIEEVALGHSTAMARGRNFFGHGGWRTRCAELRERLKGTLCGEIVARGQKTHEDVFRAWLNSPPHREVIEGKTYTHTGLGFIADRKGMIYWTQMFLVIE